MFSIEDILFVFSTIPLIPLVPQFPLVPTPHQPKPIPTNPHQSQQFPIGPDWSGLFAFGKLANSSGLWELVVPFKPETGVQ